MFKNLPEEYETLEWYKLKNEFDIKYYPADKEELKNMLNDKNILAGEIDVSCIKDMSYLFENISPVKIDYYNVYRSLLRDTYLKDDEIEKLEYIKETGFYDKLVDIQQYIHDSYTGIEFWNVSNVNNTSYIFKNAEITIDYELWDMSSVKDADGMFDNSPMEHINYYDKMYLK